MSGGCFVVRVEDQHFAEIDLSTDPDDDRDVIDPIDTQRPEGIEPAQNRLRLGDIGGTGTNPMSWAKALISELLAQHWGRRRLAFRKRASVAREA